MEINYVNEGIGGNDKLKGAEILENGTLDIINGQGCLLLQDRTVLFGIKDDGEMGTIEELPPIPVTSHGFMSCAEVTGEIGENGKIYIHAIDTENFSALLKLMIRALQDDVQIKKLQIRCDFSRPFINDIDEKTLTTERIDAYRKTAMGFTNDVAIEDEKYGGVYPAKVIKVV